VKTVVPVLPMIGLADPTSRTVDQTLLALLAETDFKTEGAKK